MHDLCEILYSTDDVPGNGLDVTLFPPNNATDDLTDEDSGPEDNPRLDNLSANQLNSSVLITNSDTSITAITDNTDTNAKSSSTLITAGPSESSNKRQATPPPFHHRITKKTKKEVVQYEWTKDNVAQSHTEWPFICTVPDKPGKSPLDYFTKFFDEDVIRIMVTYTNQYAAKRNRLGDCSENEMLVFIGILILSGYIVVPRRKMYWQAENDSHNELVVNAIPRDRFDFIMTNLHVCNNDELDKSDRFSKIRPLLSMLKDNFKNFAPHQQHHSVDESMVPYFGRHGCKQFIKGKPIRYGYKFWCGGTSDGYIVWLEPYQGAGTCCEKYADRGLGYGVVMTYADQLLCNVPYRFFFDNLFTSIELLQDLKKRGIEASGTIRQNRIPKSCILTEYEKFRKEKRGAYEACSDKKSGKYLIHRK